MYDNGFERKTLILKVNINTVYERRCQIHLSEHCLKNM